MAAASAAPVCSISGDTLPCGTTWRYLEVTTCGQEAVAADYRPLKTLRELRDRDMGEEMSRFSRRAGWVAAAAAVAAVCVLDATWGGVRAASAQGPAPKRVLLLTHNTFYNHSNLEAIEDVLPE